MVTQADKAYKWLLTQSHEGKVSITIGKRSALAEVLGLNNRQRVHQMIKALIKDGRLVGAKGEYQIKETAS